MADIYNEFVSMLADQFEKDESEISEGTTLQDLGADSLDVMDLGMDVKEKWDVEIKREDLNKLVTVKDFVNYIQEKIG